MTEYFGIGQIQLTYDLDGNLTDDDIHHFTYDAENRLISMTPITPTAGSTKVEFGYDYMSRRVQKQVSTYNGSSWVLETEKSFVYDGWNLIQEQTTTGGSTTTDYYVWGLDVSGSLQGAGGIGGLLSKTNNLTSKIYLYTVDANGNVGQLVDASTGAIAAHYEYDPFGKLLVSTGSEAENNDFRFSTKYFDAEIELYYYGYRYYDPVLGRWMTRDPIGEQGRLNLYGFVQNNPINIFDVLGLKPPSPFGPCESNFLAGCQDHCSKRGSNVKYCEQTHVKGKGVWEKLLGVEFYWVICICDEEYTYDCSGSVEGTLTLTAPLEDYDAHEREMIKELLRYGRDIETVPRDQTQKTPDFKVDGVETEHKRVTKVGKNTLKNALKEAAEQGNQILIDARMTPISAKEAAEQILRAEGNVKKLRGRVTVLTCEGPVAF